ncbi:helix-turn-helix domain-containing protein [Bacillus pumilus]|uniref:helix-turn-helix domain-containing protein n=1 Tax=Bacillus pumilus TaxID=1408 RepID=UPI003703A1E3
MHQKIPLHPLPHNLPQIPKLPLHYQHLTLNQLPQILQTPNITKSPINHPLTNLHQIPQQLPNPQPLTLKYHNQKPTQIISSKKPSPSS